MEDPYRSNAEAEGMTNYGVEDFEKVDKIPEQDEEITTTSFTGEEAEEDRYSPGTTSSYEAAAAGASENLLNFDDDDNVHSSERTPVSDSNDFLNLGSPAAPEPSAPPMAPVQFDTNNMGDLLGDFAADTKTTLSSEPEPSSLMPEASRVEVSKPPTGIVPHQSTQLYVEHVNIGGEEVFQWWDYTVGSLNA